MLPIGGGPVAKSAHTCRRCPEWMLVQDPALVLHVVLHKNRQGDKRENEKAVWK